jgi:hypothetical protein
MTENERLLAAALVWLRNHYDLVDHVGTNPAVRAAVLDRVDRILADFPPRGVDLALMRYRYPPPVRNEQ